jgi:hypothetical protein
MMGLPPALDASRQDTIISVTDKVQAAWTTGEIAWSTTRKFREERESRSPGLRRGRVCPRPFLFPAEAICAR